jgi:hypothetical protein
MLQEGVSKREEASAWPLGTKFVILSQKRILGHIKVKTKKSLLVRKAKER